MKVCTKCGQSKPLDEFPLKRRDGTTRKSHCKSCIKKYQDTYWQVWYNRPENKEVMVKRAKGQSIIRKAENKKRVLEYLQSHPCIDCGEREPLLLDFDHVSGEKHKCVTLMYGFPWEKIAEEISKCEVRCANCHRRRHFG